VLNTKQIIDPAQEPTDRPSKAEARVILESAAQHCAEEGVLQSSTRWHGWAEYQIGRGVNGNLFEDLAAVTDMYADIERGTLDWAVMTFPSKADALDHFEGEIDYYLYEMTLGWDA
jgi:hypothetical protein